MDFVESLNELPTTYHLVDYTRKKLLADGFTEIFEKDQWASLPDKFFVVNRERHVLAFNVADYNYGIFLGANSASHGLRIKNEFFSKLGCEQCDVDFVGDGVWWSWIDRDLTVAGVAVVKGQRKLVNLKKTVCMIPSLAVHLRPGSGLKGKFEKDQFKPIFSLKDEGEECDTVLRLVAENLGCAKEDVTDFELYLVPADKAEFVGFEKNMIFGYQIGALAGSVLGLDAFLKAGKPASGLNCFVSLRGVDAQGMGGVRFFGNVLKRLGLPQTFYGRSLLVSVQPLPGSGMTDKMLKTTDVVCQLGVPQHFAIGDKLGGFLDKIKSVTQESVKRDWPAAIAPQITANTNIQSIQLACAVLGLSTVRERISIDAVDKLRKVAYDVLTLLGENRVHEE